jgi:hypothetical protein
MEINSSKGLIKEHGVCTYIALDEVPENSQPVQHRTLRGLSSNVKIHKM